MAISEAKAPAKKRILLVDDDEDIAEALHLLLSERYLVDIVANGAEALQRLQDNDYDAIVLDLMMPVMDGATLKRRLDEESRRVPVLLMSSVAELPQRAAELGVNAFIAKPLDLGALERRLEALLDDQAA